MNPELLLERSVPTTPAAAVGAPRIEAVREIDADAAGHVRHLVRLAVRGLSTAHLPATGEFAQTVRGLAGGPGGPGSTGARVEPQGTSVRYAAMAALGINRLPLLTREQVLGDRDVADVARLAAEGAARGTDPGAMAIAAWALAEVTGEVATELLDRLAAMLAEHRPLATVDLAWLLTAAVATSPLGGDDALVDRAATWLASHRGPAATYAHLVPGNAGPRWRAHVGSFADQVYPLQALARASVLTGEEAMLRSAEATARRLCELQGPAGQWWWHYDARDGSVVERYPVYSVHQHAMAPMVLLDLLEAGGEDHRDAVAAGLGWLDHHPEVVEELVSDRFGLVWRKVGRREPPKAARAIGAVTTALRPGLHLPGTDRLLPPTVVDHECRPYELGWLLHAWLPPRDPAAAAAPATPPESPRGGAHA